MSPIQRRGATGFFVVLLGLLLAACNQSPLPSVPTPNEGPEVGPPAGPVELAIEGWQQLELDLHGTDLVGKDGPLATIGADLARLYRQHQAFVRQGSVGAFRSGLPYLRVVAERVVIDAVAVADAASLRADLEALGLEDGATFGRYVSGSLPIAALGDAAALASLHSARPAAATTRVGLTDSQGDIAMRSDVARTLFGVDGSGITVGTLSDSLDCFGDQAANVASGDLPAGIIVLSDLTPVDCVDLAAIDEGRAMMQLIHDVVPGAGQAFHTAFLGQADFAQGILDLAAAGADVIVDDIGYFREPFFQDGIISQAIDTVEAAGVPYFAAAGNASRSAYASAYNPSGLSCPLPAGFQPCELHDFDPGPGIDRFQQLTIPEGTSFIVSFQWDQPAFAVSGAPGSASDYDILLLDAAATTILAASLDINVGADPIEFFGYTNPVGSGTTTFNMVISKYDPANTPDAGLMHYLFTGGNSIVFEEFGTASPTSFGHSMAEGGAGVGAADYRDTPAFGVDPALLESFSSAGGIPILFDTAGNRLATPLVRSKPDFVAPDRTNNTFFGGGDPENDGFPNFSGTSAAAPHAAAVAALMLDLDSSLTPDEVFSILEATALDMIPPPGVFQPAAFDFDTGFGLIQADAALAAIPPKLSFTQTVVSANEGAGIATFIVERLGASSGAVSVEVASSDGSATAGSDFVAVAETLTWGAGDVSDRTVTVTLLDDGVDEPTESAMLSLSNPSGGAVLANSEATLTIIDNDETTLSFTQTEVSVGEEAGTATFTVGRVGASSGAVSVEVASSDGSATAGSDFVAVAETLTWGASDVSDRTVTVTLNDDDVDEPTESAMLSLSNPSGGAVLANSEATLTIIDDDQSTLTFTTGPMPPEANVSGVPGDEVAVLQVTVALSDGADDLDLQAMQVASTAAGVDASTNDIRVRVYSDANENGQVDAGETALAQASFSGTSATLDLDAAGNAATLGGGDTVTLLITFEVANPLPSAVLALLLAPLGLALRFRGRVGRWLLLSLLVVGLAGCPAVVQDTTRTYSSSLSDVTVQSTTLPVPDEVGLPVGGGTLSVTP